MQNGWWQTFSILLEINGLIVFISILMISMQRIGTFPRFKISYAWFLKVLYCLLLGAILLPMIRWELPQKAFEAPVKQYAEMIIENGEPALSQKHTVAIATLPAIPQVSKEPDWQLSIDQGLVGLSLLGLLFFSLRYVQTHWSIRQLLEQSFRIRQMGRVQVWVSDLVQEPFSIAIFRKRYVFMPNYLIHDTQTFRISLHHEIQHHRQGDTRFIYIIEALRCFLFYNPFVWLLASQFNKIQELACDETLIGQNKVSSGIYSSGLLKVATHPMRSNPGRIYGKLVGTANLSASATFLKRRLLVMRSTQHFSKLRNTLLSLIVFLSFFSAVYAAKNLTESHTISMEQAQGWVQQSQSNSTIPLFVNGEVLQHLNTGVGTATGRDALKASLERMKNYEEMIVEKLASSGLPQELLAVPLLESGFQMDVGNRGRGIWQFIPKTARKYDLNVDETQDERLDAFKLTDAATMMYADLIDRPSFEGNWHLALMAYYSGTGKIERSVRAAGSSETIEVLKQDKIQRSQDYLNRLMAHILILKHPEVLD